MAVQHTTCFQAVCDTCTQVHPFGKDTAEAAVTEAIGDGWVNTGTTPQCWNCAPTTRKES